MVNEFFPIRSEARGIAILALVDPREYRKIPSASLISALQSGSECTRPAYARVMREVVARRIIDMAQRGIRDQKELANGALRFLAANYRLERKRRQGSFGMAVAPLALPEITAADGGKSLPAP